MQADDSEPLDAEGFCVHDCIGGAGCSEWEHGWVKRLAAEYDRLAGEEKR